MAGEWLPCRWSGVPCRRKLRRWLRRCWCRLSRRSGLCGTFNLLLILSMRIRLYDHMSAGSTYVCNHGRIYL